MVWGRILSSGLFATAAPMYLAALRRETGIR